MRADPSAPAGPKRPRWMIAVGALKAIADAPGVRGVLEGPDTFVIVRKGPAEVPSGWRVTPVLGFTACHDVEQALAGGRPDGVGGVLYDPEWWAFTPEPEQRDPGHYIARAAAAAHGRGLFLIAAAGTSLAQVVSPGKGPRYRRLLEAGVLASAARAADVIDIQAQGLLTAPRAYVEYVTEGTAQARAANPAIVVLAGLSTNPPGPVVTADHLEQAVAATIDVVDGYWLNVPSPGPRCPTCNPIRPDLAVSLLNTLAG